jgi:hypothetical protein
MASSRQVFHSSLKSCTARLPSLDSASAIDTGNTQKINGIRYSIPTQRKMRQISDTEDSQAYHKVSLSNAIPLPGNGFPSRIVHRFCARRRMALGESQ